MAKVSTGSSAAVINEIKKRAKGAWSDSKKAAPKKGFISLPPGIRRGVARLVGASMKMTEDKGKGSSPMVAFKFIVREPIEYEGSIQFKNHFIEAKTGKYPKTIAEVLDGLSSDLQNLGVQQGEDGLPDIESWPEMLADLQTEKPYFYFHTWAGEGADRASLFIDGPVSEADAAAFAESPTEAPEDAEALVEAAEAEPAKSAPARRGPPPKAPPKAPPAEDEVVEVSDEPVAEEPVSKKEPEVGDRCYLTVKGEQLTGDIVDVDGDNKFVTFLADATDEKGNPSKSAHAGKKFKASWDKLEKDNPDE